jgi:uncharacterized LabA/DUF88 family protein
MIRVIAFVDGFNLYHAVKDLQQNHLKWLNLRALCEQFLPSSKFNLTRVLYFSAFATWLTDAYAKHRMYVKALQSTNVEPIMGKFKEKDRRCLVCGSTWKGHEEKETDVNIALCLMANAVQNQYDRALLVTGDSDIAPAVRMTSTMFPNKEFRLLTPVGRRHSMELLQAVGGKKHCSTMKPVHLQRALFPDEVLDASGKLVAKRPLEYTPV